MEEDRQEERPSASAFFRHRSPTFSREEVKALLNIVEKYKTIVFNKSTTAAASHAKEATWLKIAKIFNRQGFRHVRSADCLKIKWDNMKKEARKMSKNLMDIRYSEFDEVTGQMVAMMCEAENNTNVVDEPVESDGDLNETDNLKESNNIHWDGEDKDSNFSSIDGANDNSRFMSRSMNFSADECNLLLQCVRQEKNVIFSKTNTASFNKIKSRAWERNKPTSESIVSYTIQGQLKMERNSLIASSYNKLSPQKRSTKVLRTKFTNMKRMVKTKNIKKYFKEFGKKLEESGNEIKIEPLFESRSSLDAEDDDDVDDHMEADNKSNSDINTTLDPLSTVLNSDLGISSISQFENKEIVKLKLELLNYKLETAKLKRKRIEDLMQADAAERESMARESSLKLRAARLEAIAAEMKFPPAHPALSYTAEETRAQHYIHQYHTT